MERVAYICGFEINRCRMMHPKYRPDIDGLRAVAVMIVVLHHAFPEQLKTGYIGVDIFFVISGFLISSIIFSSLEQQRFSIADFYRRRILRIFPALIAVMLFTWVMGWLVLFRQEFIQLGQHITAGALFVSNLLLWSEAGYFDTASYAKPLLHLWSLGIEEQFYILWPLILWATWKRHLGFLLITLGLLTCSFAWNLYEALSGHDTADFYSPLTRLWELMAGGLLAYLKQHPQILPGYTRWGSGWRAAWQGGLGLALIVVGLIVLKGHLAYPGYRALLPVCGALLLISAGPDAWVNRRLLGNRLMVGIGLISYPLYLWHWPLLVYAYIINHGDFPALSVRFQIILLSMLLAYLTYRWIERPVRFGLKQHPRAPFCVAMMLAIIAGAGGLTWIEDGFPARNANAAEGVLGYTANSLKPPTGDQSFCSTLYQQQPGHEALCVLHSPQPEYLIVGDSHAGSLSLGAVEHQDVFRSMIVSSPGCLPFLDIEIQWGKGDASRCRKLGDAVLFAAAGLPSLHTVVLMNRGPLYFTEHDYGKHPATDVALLSPDHQRLRGRAAEDAWVAGYVDLISRLTALGKQVVFFVDWPELSFEPKACVSRALAFGPSHDCTMPRAEVDARQRIYRDLLARIQAAHPALIIYDTNPLFCNASVCTAMVNGVLYYLDDDHISPRGSEAIVLDYVASRSHNLQKAMSVHE